MLKSKKCVLSLLETPKHPSNIYWNPKKGCYVSTGAPCQKLSYSQNFPLLVTEAPQKHDSALCPLESPKLNSLETLKYQLKRKNLSCTKNLCVMGTGDIFSTLTKLCLKLNLANSK